MVIEALCCNQKFERIYHATKNLVLRTACYYMKSKDIGVEIYQTAFLLLYINLDMIDEATGVSWVVKVTKNLCANEKKRRFREVSMDDVEAMCQQTPEVESPEEICIRLERERKIRELKIEIFNELKEKNPRWYEALVHVYEEERPQKEIAEELGVSLEVLHSMLYRARKGIQKKYKERFDQLNYQEEE